MVLAVEAAVRGTVAVLLGRTAGLAAPAGDLLQPRIALRLEPPALVLGEMQMEDVELVQRQQVDESVQVAQRNEVPAGVQVQPAPARSEADPRSETTGTVSGRTRLPASRAAGGSSWRRVWTAQPTPARSAAVIAIASASTTEPVLPPAGVSQSRLESDPTVRVGGNPSPVPGVSSWRTTAASSRRTGDRLVLVEGEGPGAVSDGGRLGQEHPNTLIVRPVGESSSTAIPSTRSALDAA